MPFDGRMPGYPPRFRMPPPGGARPPYPPFPMGRTDERGGPPPPMRGGPMDDRRGPGSDGGPDKRAIDSKHTGDDDEDLWLQRRLKKEEVSCV